MNGENAFVVLCIALFAVWVLCVVIDEGSGK